MRYFHFNFHVKTGRNVATKKEKNSKDWEIIDGKKSVGKIIPMSIDLEKSGLGNKSKPVVKPTIIDM